MAVQKLIESDEMKTKVPPLTLAFVVGMLVLGFYCGSNYAKINHQDEVQKIQHDNAIKLQELQHTFAIQEVDGARADMAREDAHLQKQVDELKKKLDDIAK